MTEADLIPTEEKDKLPKSLSYPLGAQEISRSLTGVAQYDRLSLKFHYTRMVWKSAFQAALRKGLEYPVLEADYHYFPKTVHGPGFVSWSLHIYAVLRKKRHIAHELLSENGLTNVREWLSMSRPDTWFSRSHSLTLTFEARNNSVQIYDDSSTWESPPFTY